MHRLWALIWKSYRVRTRSYHTTLLEVCGPILTITLYILFKIMLNMTHSIQIDDSMKEARYFRNPPNDRVNLKQDIAARMCPRVLYHSNVDGEAPFRSYLKDECGLELHLASSRGELVRRLKESLDSRVAVKRLQVNLNRKNSTADNCIRLPSGNGNSTGGVIYQLGLERASPNSVEIHATDSAGSSVIHVPYTQGSSYNEYKLPISDLNLGIYLIEICLTNAYKRSIKPAPPVTPTTAATSSPPVSTPSTATSARTTTTTEAPSRGSRVAIETDRQGSAGIGLKFDDIKWRIKPYPAVTGVYLVTLATVLFILIASLFPAMAIVLQIAEANELGLHRYTRLAGLPSGLCYLNEFIVAASTSFVVSFVLALMLGIPTGRYLYDPITDATMTIRWLAIGTYSVCGVAHSIFLGSLFDKRPHAILALIGLATSYVMYPLLLVLQWTPYGFKSFSLIAWISIMTPCSTFEALCSVIIGVAMQNNTPFGWSNLSERIVNGGFSDLSVSELCVIQVIQTFVWILMVILVDQYRYSTTSNFFGYIISQLNDLCCCNTCGYQHETALDEMTRAKTIKSTLKSAISRKDPNRICCSLRKIEVGGSERLLPYTKGNPLKLSREQMHELRAADKAGLSKTAQYLVNRKLAVPNISRQRDEPILLDVALRQHIFWYKTPIKFTDLNLDFRFNQVTFILGQTDLKELLFETLLGLHHISSGQIYIDGTRYTPATMSLARRQIGYLGEKDIFYQDLSIFENLQLFGSIRDPSYKSFDSESLYILSLLHLTLRRNDPPSALTQRSARKLALAVALVGYTKLLLLTEPTLNLRWRPRCQIYNLLRKYKSIRSIVVDTSDVDEAVAFGDRVVLLKNGAADLNDEPRRLIKKLGCGYLLVFEPSTGDGRTINSEAIRAMERMTHDLFKQDKIGLDATKRSIYQDLDHLDGRRSVAKSVVSPKSPQVGMGKSSIKMSKVADDLHRVSLVAKIRHTGQSERGLCDLLNLYAKSNLHGFRLAQVNYESLEDILVLRMSRAVYPDLPPDLLLSLQHRTQASHKTQASMSISVRKQSGLQPQQSVATSIFNSSILTIIKDRFSERSEIVLLCAALFGSFVIMAIALLSLKYSLKSDDRHDSLHDVSRRTSQTTMADNLILRHTSIDRLYKNRIGFYILERGGDSRGSDSNLISFNGNVTATDISLLQSWPGNRNLLGLINLSSDNRTDAQIVATLVDKSKDLAGSLIIYDPRSGETIVVFEPHLPHMLLASIRTFLDFALANDKSNVSQYPNQARQDDFTVAPSTSQLLPMQPIEAKERDTLPEYNNDGRPMRFETSRYNFQQPWHEIIQGYPSRRLIYGIGFAFAEAISIGVLVIVPIRHRLESRLKHIQIMYWIKMAVVDLILSSFTVAGYLILFITIEEITSSSLLLAMLLVMFIYKLTSLPIPYLLSMMAESTLNAFIALFLLYFVIVWQMAIFIESYISWTLIGNDLMYSVANWVTFAIPVTALIESIVVIGQVNNIEARCQDVPAFVATTNSVELDGVHKFTVVDSLLEKVHECLASGKTSVTTDVMHKGSLGIIWHLYLMLLFGAITWIFLFTCERLFGFVVRQSTFSGKSTDPMKTVVRLPESNNSLFAWDKEKDRLISEYMRCLNETKYVKLMAKNCVILRIWLKPFDNQVTLDGRLSSIIEPLSSLGYTKSNLQIELRTTLQIFIRLGDESNPVRVSKIDLIETYKKFAAAHSDIVAKFAVVNWTRENLYKILLHGYFNNKTVLS